MKTASELQNEADSITRFISSFEKARDIIAAAAVFEQQEKAAKERAGKAGLEADAAEIRRLNAVAELSKANAEVEAARKAANELLANARSRADEILGDARTEADELRNAAQAAFSKAEADVARARADAKVARDAVDAAQAELAGVNARIEQAKEAARKLFGS